VRDPSGSVVFTRVMRPGDSYNVPNRGGLSLYTGSAGALEFTVDGKMAPSVGQPGTVRRDVMLDPDRLLAGTAVLDQKRPSSSAEPRPIPTPAASPRTGG
jgi:cytoskeleton protein RodZ